MRKNGMIFSGVLSLILCACSGNSGEIKSVELSQNVSFTGRGNAFEVVLGAKVEVLTADSAALKSVRFSLNGTTDLADLTTVRFFATDSARFDERIAAGARLLGEVKDLKNGEMVCPLNGFLKNGENHIWLTVAIAENAKEGNKIDAEIQAISLKGAEFSLPTTSVEGEREIILARTLVLAPGDYGSKNYRIPALICLPDGTLLTTADKRKFNQTDLPEDIDIIALRSHDLGKTWGEAVTIAQGKGYKKGFGDAALTVAENGDVICAYVGGNQLWASTDDDPQDSYVCRSTDGGKTWQDHQKVTHLLWGKNCKDKIRKNFTSSFFGSGAGLTIKHGKYKGRIIFVAAINNKGKLCNYAFFSDDNGKTWNVSNQASYGGDEAKCVELADGTILMSIRHSGKRWFNTSADGGKTWGQQREWDEINTNACNGDIIRLSSVNDGEDKNRLLHSVPNHEKRRNVSVFISYDEGKTWPRVKSICHYESIYSSLAVLPDGTIGAYIEEDFGGDCHLYFLRFSLSWLTDGEDQFSK